MLSDTCSGPSQIPMSFILFFSAHLFENYIENPKERKEKKENFEKKKRKWIIIVSSPFHMILRHRIKNNTHTKWEKIKDWNVEALTLNSFKCKTRLKHFAVTPHYEKCRDPLLS